MPLKIKVRAIGMAKEERQLREIMDTADGFEKGDTVLFPEYGAYTVEGSKIAYAELSRYAPSKGVTIITSLNYCSEDLPCAEPDVNYNTLFIFSRSGRTYSPQAKITPQSFEMRHMDRACPKMDVAPYSHLNRVTLRQNGETYSAFFFICSDLYVFQMFTYHQLKSDAMFCPANFGNGAEGSAGEVIDYAVKTGLFKRGFFCNIYQEEKEGRVPLTKRVERSFETDAKELPYSEKEMAGLLEKTSVVYPDDPGSGFTNFQTVLQLTLNGTFTVPRSRSLENDLEVKLGTYDKVIEL